jgi:LPS export ABC transporter protein LptC
VRFAETAGRQAQAAEGGGDHAISVAPACRRPTPVRPFRFPHFRPSRLAVCLLALALAPACKDDGVRPNLTLTAADSADQVLEDMETVLSTNGVRRTRVLADTAYIYEASQLARLKRVKVTFYDANGVETSTVVGDSGLYHMQDGSMSAAGHVVATTPDGRTLRSEELKYDARKQQVYSDQPFVYQRPGEHLAGDAFRSDPDFKNVVAVRPHGGQRGGPGGRDSTGGFLLPGQ